LTRKLALVLALIALPVLAAACGDSDSDGPPSELDATFEAALDVAEKTPVSDDLRDYASQLCDPMVAFLNDAGDTFAQLENQATSEGTPEDLDDAFGAMFGLFGELESPFRALRDELDDVDPPDALQDYHESFITELDALLDFLSRIEDEGFASLFAMPTESPTVDEPPGFEAALIQECGEDMKDLLDDLGDFDGGSFFGGDDGSAATPSAPGQIGDATTSADFELTVHSVTDPYTTSDDFFAPEPGNRWVLLDVSLANVSDESQDYSSFDFTVRDADNFLHDATYTDAPQELDFGSLLPGETIRGTVSFEVPEDAALRRLVFERGFLGEERIDIELD
jgi:hypothetical protein